MKNILYILLLTGLFLSCKSNTKQNKKDTTATKPVMNQTEKLIESFKAVIQGSWVNKGYIEEIARTRSPFLSATKVGNISTMLIGTKFLKDDTLRIDIGYGNHEGGEFILKFQHGKTEGSIIAYSPFGPDVDGSTYELNYDINRKDTTLILYTFDKNKKPIDTTNYFRVFKNFEGHELGYSTYYMVNKTLISGSYILTDTLNNSSNISFNNLGKVKGFKGADNFSIDVDFETPPGNNMDQIDFKEGDKTDVTYGFKFDHDTLNLYRTSLDKDSIALILGKRIYKLVKQK